MSSTPAAGGEIPMDVAPLPRMVWLESRAKFLNRVRVPAFTFFSLVMPVGFFALFNGIYGNSGAMGEVGKWLLASYGTYACGLVMVFNFGMGISNDRGQKMDVLQKAMPLPAAVANLAHILSALLFAALSLLILFAYALTIGGVHLDGGTTMKLLVALLLGSLPFGGLGMAIGYGVGPNAAPAVTNAIYLPMTFLSGIFIPLQILPSAIRTVGSWLPTYHYAQLAWSSVGGINKVFNPNPESLLTSVLWLAGWGVVLFLLALRIYRLDQNRKFA